ncbi:MAG: TonB-dependent receptor [Bacteroidota bacterium]|nr:TonB-dependent receptor [Bacteroidota bacterium]MDP4251044.1 TonB-dependent receptor [Bacteroidota bacterium]
MKLSVALILITCLQVSARGNSQEKFSLHFKKAEVAKIFATIEKESNYRFFYNNGYISKLGKVDLEVTDSPLDQILNMILGDKFTYTINNGNMVIISPAKQDDLTEATAVADGEIRGKVVDENGNPLSGVTIRLNKSNKTVLSDENGNFSIVGPDNAQLTISYVGYKDQIVDVNGRQAVSIQLQPSAAGLNEVVVVGYGTQKKRDVTGTISSVKGDDFKNLPVSNAADALQGRASGVDIVRDDGSPGSTPSIRIRGTGTLNNSDPLVVIDGVPAGGLNDVNPNDIASVEILKDASSSAIYGSRAANGVVIITTKKGNFGEKLKTTLNLYTGSNKAVKYLNMLKAPDLVTLKQEAYNNDGLSVPTLWSDPYYATQRTDWQKALLGTGHVNNADIAVRGGNASSTYSFSGNYYDEKGLIVNSYFRRYSFRMNSEHKIGSRIRVGENVVYSNTNGLNPDTKSTQTGLVWSAIRFNPAIPVLNPDGSWGTSQADNQLGDINNPVATANENTGYGSTDRLLANGYAELEIIKGLKLRANYGYDQSVGEGDYYSNAMPDQTRGPSIASLNRTFGKSRSFLEEYYLNYVKQFGSSHELNLTAGYSSQVSSGNYFNAARSGFADTSVDQRVLNLGSNSSQSNSGYNYATSGLQSYFIRGNYAFQNRYLLTVTMRADGSSKFAPGKRWGYFPAFSAGWRVSDEHFYGENLKKTINSLKITGGWGQLGNQNIGDFQYLSTIGYSGGYGYNLGTGNVLQSGAVVTGLANPNITWERAVMTNISMELATLNNHLTAVVTYFDKNTTDMLVPFQLVETFGAQTNLPDDGGNVTLPNQNIGTLNNHGVEIELNYQNKAGKLNYSFGANGSFIRNKVTKLYGAGTYIGSTPYGRENTDISRTYEGQPLASFYGFKTAGIYQTQSEIDSDPNIANDPNKANIKPGDVKFLDVNGTAGKKDGIINDNDRVNLGDPNPHFVFGFHGALNYGGFDLVFNFAGSMGFKLYNADRLAGLDGTQVFNWYNEELGRWHGQGTSNSIPRLTIQNLNNNYRSSDLWIQNGNYLSLKNLSLGYTLSNKQISDVKIPEIRVYVSSYNLFMLTSYKGYTPELGYTSGGNKPANSQRGVDVAQYPAARNFTIGATINF